MQESPASGTKSVRQAGKTEGSFRSY